jgi:Protein of unknown function (DUF2637)
VTARRFFSIAGASVVGLIAGAASYTHMRQVGIDTHQGMVIASIVPLSVDGLVLVATLAIGDGRRHTFTAWLAFLIGVGVSLAANVAAADPDTLARCWSAWPSAGFLLAVEVLIRGSRKRVEEPEIIKPLGDSEPPKSEPDRSDTTRKPRAPRRDSNAKRVAAAVKRTPDATPVQIAARLGVDPKTVKRYLSTDKPALSTSEPVTDDLRAEALAADDIPDWYKDEVLTSQSG